MPEPLTDRQRAVLTFLWDYLCEHGFQPSMREIAEHMGTVSPNSVNGHLHALHEHGWIDFGAKKRNRWHEQRRKASNSTQAARAIRLLYTPDGKPFIGLRAKTDAPKAGQYVAPQPIGTWGGSEND